MTFRILVATDFSGIADAALQTAIDLARRIGTGLEILHVEQPVASVQPEGVTFGSSEAMAQYVTRQLAERAERAHAEGVACEATSIEGAPAQAILDYARRHSSDLIVLGTHGRTGFRRALLGSVSEQVTRRAPCAVLIVPVAAQRD